MTRLARHLLALARHHAGIPAEAPKGKPARITYHRHGR